MQPAVADGAAAPASPLAQTSDPVTLTIGGQSAKVLYAGLAPGFAGLYQIDTIVHAGITAPADVPVVITVDGIASPAVSLALQ